MRKLARYLVLLSWMACAPDLDANGAERCDEHGACEQGMSCYRGFCVLDASDAGAARDDSETSETIESADAGKSLLSADAGSAQLPSVDAGELPRPDAGAPARDAGAALAEPPDAGSDAGRPKEPARVLEDAGAHDARPPDVPQVPDAGHPSCTLKSCCQEAKHAIDTGEKLDGLWTFKKGKCGCADPDLMTALGCLISQHGAGR